MAAQGVGRYTRVGEQKGTLIIGGAEKKMAADPTFTYVPLFRVAGTRKEVDSWLSEHHPDQTKEALKGSYSVSTLKNKTVREAYEKELARASEARSEVSNAKAALQQVDLMILVKLLKKYDEQKRQGMSVSSMTTAKNGTDLKEKVKGLTEEGKVLDVTNMKAKGSDSKKMVMKDNSTKRRLSQQETDPFYNVVYNPRSKQSVTGVKNFLKLYGGFDSEKIKNITDALEEGSVINLGRGKSPTRSPLMSPTRRTRGKRSTKKTVDDVENILDEL